MSIINAGSLTIQWQGHHRTTLSTESEISIDPAEPKAICVLSSSLNTHVLQSILGEIWEIFAGMGSINPYRRDLLQQV